MGSAGKRAFERRKSEKPKVHRYRPASIYQATTKAKRKPAETLTPGEKVWGPQQPLLPLPVPSPRGPSTQGEGSGQRGMVKSLKRSLDVCVVEPKPTSRLWRCPRAMGHRRLFAARWGVDSVRWDSTWLPKDWSGALPPPLSLISPNLEVSLNPLSRLW